MATSLPKLVATQSSRRMTSSEKFSATLPVPSICLHRKTRASFLLAKVLCAKKSCFEKRAAKLGSSASGSRVLRRRRTSRTSASSKKNSIWRTGTGRASRRGTVVNT